MLLRSLFIAFITISQFFNFAKAQNEIINEFEGIIFYYETDSIPQDVFLLPCKVEYKGDFTDFVVNTLKNYKGKLIEIYFQGMRWGVPNLLSIVRRMDYLESKRITGNGGSFNLRISAGIIYTDATYPTKLFEYKENKAAFILQFNSIKFNFIVYDFDREKNGQLIFFEPLYLK